MLMASGGKPRRRNAVNVNNLGSSQSLYNKNKIILICNWPTPGHSGVLAIIPDDALFDKLKYFAFGQDRVANVQTAVFPLYGTVQVETIA